MQSKLSMFGCHVHVLFCNVAMSFCNTNRIFDFYIRDCIAPPRSHIMPCLKKSYKNVGVRKVSWNVYCVVLSV